MAFYENRVEHFGGALVLFKRNLAVAVPNAKSHRKQAWYMRLKIGGRKGYITRSVGCYTLQGRCVRVLGVKSGDLCGSEDAVVQGADWHSDVGRKWDNIMKRLNFALVAKFRISIFVVLALATFLTFPSNVLAETNGDRIERFAEQLPRNIIGLPMYWFELNSAIGWEKMMLIFGYADNRPICELMIEFAKINAPTDKFRCTVAN